MAEGDFCRKPAAVTEEVSLTEVKVKLVVDGIAPHTFGSKRQPKNGELYIKFTNCGFEMSAVVKEKTQDKKWNFTVKKLPSEIEAEKCSWKVEKGLVVISLIKATEVSWVPMLRSGLEQAESESEEDD